MGNLFRSLHWPRLFVAVASAALVLGLAAASSPMFLSSAANAMLHDELRLIGNVDSGLTARLFGFVNREQFDAFQTELYKTVTPIRRLEGPTATTIGAALAVRKAGTTDEARMRLFYRDGALDNVQRLEGDVSNPGVWMNDAMANGLGVDVGDDVELVYGGGRSDTTIAGIYRALNAEPITEYWRPLTFEIVNPRDFDLTPPPFLISDKETFFQLGGNLADQAEMVWHFPLEPRGMNYEEALELERRFNVVHSAGDDPLTPLGRTFRDLRTFTFQPLSIDSHMFSLMDRIRATVTTLDSSVRVVSYAGQAVALFAIGGAGLFMARRRQTELRSMLAQGVSPTGIGAAFALEVVVPVALGVAGGWVAARGMVSWLGPGTTISPDAALEGLIGGGIAAALGIVVLAAVVAGAARRETEIGFARVRKVLGRTPWEAFVLILAAAAYYEMSRGRTAVVTGPSDAPELDLFVLAFPLLFISGMAGLGGRLLKRMLPQLRSRGDRTSIALYLTWKRLADSSAAAVLLISLSAVAVGVLVYSSTLVDSIEATIQAKARVATGSDLVVTVTPQTATPDAPFPVTRVARMRGELLPGDIKVDVIGIDPATFESVAFWEDDFSGSSLAEIVASLGRNDERLSGVVAGVDVDDEMTLHAADFDAPIDVIDQPVAFPGMRLNSPIVVVDRGEFQTFAKESGSGGLARVVTTNEVWGSGDPEAVLEHFRSKGLGTGAIYDSRDFLAAGSLRAVTWTFGLMQALGALAALIVLVALLFYLESRQREREVSYGLARRMGLSPDQHRVALAAELFGMLAIAILVGEISAIAGARLVLSHVDPLPSMPPPVLFRLPMTALLASIPMGAAIAAIGAWFVQRSADRVRMAEVMRVAG